MASSLPTIQVLINLVEGDSIKDAKTLGASAGKAFTDTFDKELSSGFANSFKAASSAIDGRKLAEQFSRDFNRAAKLDLKLNDEIKLKLSTDDGSMKDFSRSIEKSVKDGFNSVGRGNILGDILSSPFKLAGGALSSIANGFTISITGAISSKFGSGLSSAIESSIVGSFGSSELLAKKLGEKLGSDISKGLSSALGSLEVIIDQQIKKIKKHSDRHKAEDFFELIKQMPSATYNSTLNVLGDGNIKSESLASHAAERKKRQEKKGISQQESLDQLRDAENAFTSATTVNNNFQAVIKKAISEAKEGSQKYAKLLDSYYKEFETASGIDFKTVEKEAAKIQRDRQKHRTALEDLDKLDEKHEKDAKKYGSAAIAIKKELNDPSNPPTEKRKEELNEQLILADTSYKYATVRLEDNKKAREPHKKALSNLDKEVSAVFGGFDAEATENSINTLIPMRQAYEKSLVELEELTRKSFESIKKVKLAEARRNNAFAKYKELNPQDETPKAYEDLARVVLGESFSKENLPQLIPNDEALKKSKARAEYNPVTNKIHVTSDLYRQITGADKLNEEQRWTLGEELAHARDFDFGSRAGVQAVRANRTTTKALQPTTDELKEIETGFLNLRAYSPERRSLELNAKIQSLRAAKTYGDEQEVFEKSRGLGKITKISDSTDAARQLFDAKIPQIKEYASKINVDVEGLVEKYRSLFEDLEKYIHSICVSTASNIGNLSSEGLSEQIQLLDDPTKKLGLLSKHVLQSTKEYRQKSQLPNVFIPIAENREVIESLKERVPKNGDVANDLVGTLVSAKKELDAIEKEAWNSIKTIGDKNIGEYTERLTEMFGKLIVGVSEKLNIAAAEVDKAEREIKQIQLSDTLGLLDAKDIKKIASKSGLDVKGQSKKALLPQLLEVEDIDSVQDLALEASRRKAAARQARERAVQNATHTIGTGVGAIAKGVGSAAQAGADAVTSEQGQMVISQGKTIASRFIKGVAGVYTGLADTEQEFLKLVPFGKTTKLALQIAGAPMIAGAAGALVPGVAPIIHGALAAAEGVGGAIGGSAGAGAAATVAGHLPTAFGIQAGVAAGIEAAGTAIGGFIAQGAGIALAGGLTHLAARKVSGVPDPESLPLALPPSERKGLPSGKPLVLPQAERELEPVEIIPKNTTKLKALRAEHEEALQAASKQPIENAKNIAEKAGAAIGNAVAGAEEIAQNVGEISATVTTSVKDAIKKAEAITKFFWETYDNLKEIVSDGDLSAAQKTQEILTTGAKNAQADLRALYKTLAEDTPPELKSKISGSIGQVGRASKLASGKVEALKRLKENEVPIDAIDVSSEYTAQSLAEVKGAFNRARNAALNALDKQIITAIDKLDKLLSTDGAADVRSETRELNRLNKVSQRLLEERESMLENIFQEEMTRANKQLLEIGRSIEKKYKNVDVGLLGDRALSNHLTFESRSQSETNQQNLKKYQRVLSRVQDKEDPDSYSTGLPRIDQDYSTFGFGVVKNIKSFLSNLNKDVGAGVSKQLEIVLIHAKSLLFDLNTAQTVAESEGNKSEAKKLKNLGKKLSGHISNAESTLEKKDLSFGDLASLLSANKGIRSAFSAVGQEPPPGGGGGGGGIFGVLISQASSLKGILGAIAPMFGIFSGAMLFQQFAGEIGRINTQALQAAENLDKLKTALEFASGSAAKGASDLSFVDKTVDDLKVPLASSRDGFERLAASTKGTAVQGAATRSVFLGMEQASTVLGLSAEQTQSTLNALAQMASKGTISTQDLKDQLGSSLPGAMDIAAKSIGVTTDQLNKMLAAGSITSEDFLPKFGMQLQREFGANSKSASQNAMSSRFNLENKSQIALEKVGGILQPGQMVLNDLLAKALELVTLAIDKLGAIATIVAAQLGGNLLIKLGAIAVNAFTSGTAVNLLGGIVGSVAIKIATAAAAMAGKFILFSLAVEAVQTIFKAFVPDEATSQVNNFTSQAVDGLKAVQEAAKAANGEIAQAGNTRLKSKGFDFFGFFTSDDVLNRSNDKLGTGFVTKASHDFDKQKEALDNQAIAAQNVGAGVFDAKGMNDRLAKVKALDEEINKLTLEQQKLQQSPNVDPHQREALLTKKRELTEQRDLQAAPILQQSTQIDAALKNVKDSLDAIDKQGLPADKAKELKDQLTPTLSVLESMQKIQKGYNDKLNEAAILVANFGDKWQKALDRIEDFNKAVEKNTALTKTAILSSQLSGDISPQQAQYATAAADRAGNEQKLAQLTQSIEEMQKMMLTINASDTLKGAGINPNAGDAELKTASSKTSNPKVKQAADAVVQLNNLKSQAVTLDEQIRSARVQAQQQLNDTTKAIVDFFNGIKEQTQQLAIESKQVASQVNMIKAETKLKSALVGFADGFIDGFVNGLVDLVKLLDKPKDDALSAEMQILQNNNKLNSTLKQSNSLSEQIQSGRQASTGDVNQQKLIEAALLITEGQGSNITVRNRASQNYGGHGTSMLAQALAPQQYTGLGGTDVNGSHKQLTASDFTSVSSLAKALGTSESDILGAIARNAATEQQDIANIGYRTSYRQAGTTALHSERGDINYHGNTYLGDEGRRDITPTPIYSGNPVNQTNQPRTSPETGSYMAIPRYTIYDSHDDHEIQGYADISRHHISSGIEPGRTYDTVQGKEEEVRRTSDGRELVKKDMVIQRNGSSNVQIPSPMAGYAEALDDGLNTVKIYADQQRQHLQVVLMHMKDIQVKTGQQVVAGQYLGTQSNTGSGAVHLHGEMVPEAWNRYVQSLNTGKFVSGTGLQGLAQGDQLSESSNAALANNAKLSANIQQRLAAQGQLDRLNAEMKSRQLHHDFKYGMIAQEDTVVQSERRAQDVENNLGADTPEKQKAIQELQVQRSAFDSNKELLKQHEALTNNKDKLSALIAVLKQGGFEGADALSREFLPKLEEGLTQTDGEITRIEKLLDSNTALRDKQLKDIEDKYRIAAQKRQDEATSEILNLKSTAQKSADDLANLGIGNSPSGSSALASSAAQKKAQYEADLHALGEQVRLHQRTAEEAEKIKNLKAEILVKDLAIADAQARSDKMKTTISTLNESKKGLAGRLMNTGSPGDYNRGEQMLKEVEISDQLLKNRQRLLDLEKQINDARGTGAEYTAEEAAKLRKAVADLNSADLQNLDDKFNHTKSVVTDLGNSMQQSFGTAFEDLIKGSKSFSQIFNDLIGSLLSKLANLAVNEVFKNLFGGDGKTGGLGAIFGNLFGGKSNSSPSDGGLFGGLLGGLFGGGGGNSGGGGGLLGGVLGLFGGGGSGLLGLFNEGYVPNYAGGKTATGIKDAFKREAAASSGKPYLGVFNSKEIILNEAQSARFMKSGLATEFVGGRVPNFAGGNLPQTSPFRTQPSTTNINLGGISVEGGSGKSEADQKDLASKLHQVVQNSLLAEKRPGGLLYQ